jgi:hypothetical protein
MKKLHHATSYREDSWSTHSLLTLDRPPNPGLMHLNKCVSGTPSDHVITLPMLCRATPCSVYSIHPPILKGNLIPSAIPCVHAPCFSVHPYLIYRCPSLLVPSVHLLVFAFRIFMDRGADAAGAVLVENAVNHTLAQWIAAGNLTTFRHDILGRCC